MGVATGGGGVTHSASCCWRRAGGGLSGWGEGDGAAAFPSTGACSAGGGDGADSDGGGEGLETGLVVSTESGISGLRVDFCTTEKKDNLFLCIMFRISKA